MTEIKSAFRDIAQRIENAESSFIADAQEQFGFTSEEATKILRIYKKEKIVKVDPVMGVARVSHGIFWEKETMQNALKVANGQL